MNNYDDFIYNKRIFTKEDVKDIIDSYLNKESCTKLGKRYNVSHKCILKILHQYNIDVNQKYSSRKYKINENYFDIIDTQNKAYILGFLYADGNVNIKKNKNTISISLQEEDGYILELMRKEIGSEKPLEYLDYSNKSDFGYHYKNQYRLLIFNKHMCDTLINIGMVQNKSLVLEFPNIPKELYSHFIRGYFDGDGSINKKTGSFSIISTLNFVLKVKDILETNLNISGGIVYESSNHNGITYDLYFHKQNETIKIFKWIYNNAEMYLTRKYNIYHNHKIFNNSLTA